MEKSLLPFRFSYTAESDIISLKNFLFSRSEEHAFQPLLERIKKSITLLQAFPDLGVYREDFHTHVLSVPGTSYLLLFRVKGGVLEILRIYHSSQQWK